ncbi:MAG: universal stress protein [Nitrospiraceae bacterium]|nr:MAG: universal stress protein [Nitrospiraceae bacterium]
MYKKILAAVNEFSNSEISARYALTLARSCRAKLFLAFIAEENIHKDKLKHAEAALERLFMDAEGSGIDVQTIVESGEPVSEIAEIVKAQGIDLVFTATRREDIRKRFFVRTLSRQIMVRLPCSVAIVRVVRMGGIHPGNILVPLSGRIPDIEERAYFIAKLAEGFDSGVTLFHLHKPLTGFFHGEMHLTPLQREAHIPKDVEEFRRQLHHYNIIHEKKIGRGGVARAITVEAAHKKNDLIVMGASERSLLKSIMRGNPVEDVLRHTPCNLIIFRGTKNRQL